MWNESVYWDAVTKFEEDRRRREQLVFDCILSLDTVDILELAMEYSTYCSVGNNIIDLAHDIAETNTDYLSKYFNIN